MRKHIVYTIAVIFLLSAAVYVTVSHCTDHSVITSSVESLSQGEGYICCSAGIEGYCFEKESAWPFYKCTFTGRQADQCWYGDPGWL